jgi:biopolymer transport protein ExbB/TolQ
MDIGNMLGSMGVIGIAVMACLVALSIYSISLILTKFRRFKAATNESNAFAERFAGLLKAGKFNDAAQSARQHERSHVARVVRAGVEELSDNTTNDPNTRVEMVTRALERSSTRTLAEMRTGLGALATIGSTAPFIGLFGTIIGIVHAFQGIASTGSGGVAAVSGGIAEALIATALGILVAIPAVMAFNYFVSRLESFHIEIETTSAEFVDFLQKRAHATL